jgi:hypothetical protein
MLYGISNHLLELNSNQFVLLCETDQPMPQPPDDFFGDLRDILVESVDNGSDYRHLVDVADDAVVFVPHIALLYDTFAEIDELLSACERFQANDKRLIIKNWPAYHTYGNTTSRNLVVKYILPMWFEFHARQQDDDSGRSAQ